VNGSWDLLYSSSRLSVPDPNVRIRNIQAGEPASVGMCARWTRSTRRRASVLCDERRAGGVGTELCRAEDRRTQILTAVCVFCNAAAVYDGETQTFKHKVAWEFEESVNDVQQVRVARERARARARASERASEREREREK